MEPILLNVALGEVVSEHRKRFNHRSVAFSVDPKELVADGQYDYMKQVIQNLLSNAEKYSPPDQAIEVEAHRLDDEVIISVLDRGSGIVPAESEIIFQAFTAQAKPPPRLTGAGIGLAVCKLLVQAQAGRIWTNPRPDGGTDSPHTPGHNPLAVLSWSAFGFMSSGRCL